MKFGYIFPSQGMQFEGMGQDFFENFSSSKNIFLKADKILKYSITDIIFNDFKKLSLTKYCQPAVFINSVAILEAINEIYPYLSPYIAAGLSLGEYTALYASKKISFEDCLTLLSRRAEHMSEACRLSEGKMLAVVSKDLNLIFEVIKNIKNIYIANLNSFDQIVLSGEKNAILNVLDQLKKITKKLIILDVEGAFHSPYMQPAEEKYKLDVEKVNIQTSDVKLVMNVNADVVYNMKSIKNNLIKQLTSKVRWYESMINMDRYIDNFLEIGCGNFLTNINNKLKLRSKTISIQNVDDLNKLKSINVKK
ncbi:MAG: hypothetical protein A3F40_03880 [Chlamydiae bacterium RIFCSPHIGHO2_12_FULL_27_8]|nr:MAG: hypothetical protein A3F40_03880 [Chlamydiae bacterium RIFCSPHIGHO2_12_FULL_27_8]OGN65349.1 MAG: hypothetical protein A2888_01575 [Chlamydiae bacterium RIFCSPLOWO2_01_FULL_28_7]